VSAAAVGCCWGFLSLNIRQSLAFNLVKDCLSSFMMGGLGLPALD